MKKYEFLKHTADLAIKGYGTDLSSLFLNIAEGMYEVMVGQKFPISNFQFPNKSEIRNPKFETNRQSKIVNRKSFKIVGETNEDLLVNFLNELIFQTDTNHQIFYNLQISKIKKGSLEFSGVPSPLFTEKQEIKAATYHNLKIKKSKKHYEATVVFDI